MPIGHNDGNSEKELIELLTKVLTDFFKEDRHALAAVVSRLTLLENNSHLRHQQIMTALETLTKSVDDLTASQAALTSAVNDAITRIGTPSATDAQLITLAAAIDHNTEVIKNQTTALRTALETPTPTPTPGT